MLSAADELHVDRRLVRAAQYPREPFRVALRKLPVRAESEPGILREKSDRAVERAGVEVDDPRFAISFARVDFPAPLGPSSAILIIMLPFPDI